MDKLDRVIKRMEQSKTFYKSKQYNKYGKVYSSYVFDDNLVIDAYNGILRVTFQDEVVDHYHGNRYGNDTDDGLDALYVVIHKKQKAKTDKVMARL
jgi:hypothetical protein